MRPFQGLYNVQYRKKMLLVTMHLYDTRQYMHLYEHDEVFSRKIYPKYGIKIYTRKNRNKIVDVDRCRLMSTFSSKNFIQIHF